MQGKAMSAAGIADKWRWGIAAAGAVMVIVMLGWLFRTPLTIPLPSSAAAPKASVILIEPGSATAALNEQTLLRDTTPLFLPTERNATVREPRRRESSKTFLDNEALK